MGSSMESSASESCRHRKKSNPSLQWPLSMGIKTHHRALISMVQGYKPTVQCSPANTVMTVRMSGGSSATELERVSAGFTRSR